MTSLFEKSKAGMSCGQVMEQQRYLSDADTLFDAESRHDGLALPEISEAEVVRHYTALSQKSFGVDNGSYPLGSCTMKYNPKRHDRLANLCGFRYAHPAQPHHTLAGLWELVGRLQEALCGLTGMDRVCLQPAAGAQGELLGLLMMKRYFEDLGENRSTILIADSAHGTNPASAAIAGFNCQIIPTTKGGLMDLDALKAAINTDTAALMITNPSTLGLFESNIQTIAKMVHEAGALLYYDGANLNALMGIVRPGDMGFDIMHINTHKTLSTPHGGGGPGAGPIAVKRKLQPYLPKPTIIKKDGFYVPDFSGEKSVGSIKNYFGHIGVLIRAYCYLLTMGPEGLRQASENAVLAANYVQHQLKEAYVPVFDKPCMHECLVTPKDPKQTVEKLAKRLIDVGIHPPTIVGAGCVYFADDIPPSMLIEPTETESIERLDQIVAALVTASKGHSPKATPARDASFSEARPKTANTSGTQHDLIPLEVHR